MKRLIAFALVLSMLLCGAALAQKPKYAVSGKALSFDLDNDKHDEIISFSMEETMEGKVILLNCFDPDSNSNTVHGIIDYPDYEFMTPELLIRIFPMQIAGKNRLFVEAHVTGSENVYSHWQLLSMYDENIAIETAAYDPGYTSGTGVYSGYGPDDMSSYQLYFSYDPSTYYYLMALKNHFASAGLVFDMGKLPFSGNFKAAMASNNANGECALTVTQKDIGWVAPGWDEVTVSASGTASIKMTGDAYMRTGPATTFSKVSVIKKGATAQYLGESRWDDRKVLWHYVTYGGNSGWVSSKYAPLKAVESLVPKNCKGIVEATASVNVRTGASLEYTSLGTMKKGQTLDFLGSLCLDDRDVVWFYVRYGSGTGWVSSKYTSLK